MDITRDPALTATLRRLVSTCDGVAERRAVLAAAVEKGDRAEAKAARAAHRRAARRALAALGRALGDAPLAALLPRTLTDAVEAFVALRLLSTRIMAGPAGVAGRELLGQLHEAPMDLLAAAAVLDDAAPLRRSGVVVATDHEDPLERQYRFGDARYADACRLFGVAPLPRLAPYLDATEHLADWHRLALGYRQRATLLFGEELLETLAATGPATLADANHALDLQRERMVARLMATPDRQALPALEFQRRHGLGELEMILVATLLYHPWLAGVASTSVALCAKVVAARERDLVDTAALLAPRGALRRLGLVRFEDPQLDDAEGLGAVALTPQAEAELLAEDRRVPGIRPGERSEFHRYLDGLADSGSFFRELGLGEAARRPPGREESPPAA
jgi:hypothetical protein